MPASQLEDDGAPRGRGSAALVTDHGRLTRPVYPISGESLPARAGAERRAADLGSVSDRVS